MAQVEIQAGPHRIVSLMSREAADELGLEPGVLAVAAVKSTNVVVEVPARPVMPRALPPIASRAALVALLAVPLRRVLVGRARRLDGSTRVDAVGATPVTSLTGSITVLAASSLTGVLHRRSGRVRGRAPRQQGHFSFAAELRARHQITQGAPADVFASASPSHDGPGRDAGGAPARPDDVRPQHARDRRTRRATRQVTGLADFADASGSRSPCARPRCRAARRPRRSSTSARSPRHAGHPRGRREGQRSSKVTWARSTLALVYDTDVRAAGDEGRGHRDPRGGVNASTTTRSPSLKDSAERRRTAEAFVDFVRSTEGARC